MSLVQVNGLGWSFQWSMKVPMAAVSSLTGAKVPRRMAWRVMTEKKHSTRALPSPRLAASLQRSNSGRDH